MRAFKALPQAGSDSQSPSAKKAPRVLSSEIQPLEWSKNQVNGLALDEHTQMDLEIFESGCPGKSLYELCNFTRTGGGARILKQRMELPFTEAKRIRATQDSIEHIRAHRDVFDKLPSYITRGVENYQREVLMLVTQSGSLEFAIGSLSLKLNHDRHYHNIVRGVQLTCGLVQALRAYLGQVGLTVPVGELALLCEEMNQLISHPRLQQVPDKEIGSGWFWNVLRLDQIFRLHEKGVILRLMQLIYETDALVSMADATIKYDYVMPELLAGPVQIQGEGLVHPHVEDAIPNGVHLDQQQRLLFLTGPNMAGKTTYLRAIATALYYAHLGMGVPAKYFKFVPVDSLFSSISLADNLHTGVSYFRAEVLRIKAVANAIAAGKNVVAIMDEPFKGTNVKDAFDASLAILKRLQAKENCLFMLSSHLIELEEQFEVHSNIIRCHFEAQEGSGQLQFDYKMHPGISRQRLGMRVLTEEGVFELLDQLVDSEATTITADGLN